MNSRNIAIALLSENLKTVKVRFKWSNGELSPKQYTYVSTIALEPGDEAVVNSPIGGYKVVVVEEVSGSLINPKADFDYKFIVQRVDKEADEARQEAIRALKFEINERERQRALKDLKKSLGLRKGDKLSRAVEAIRKNLI